MDEKWVLELESSCKSVSQEKSESLYPMYFGASCAFFALQLLSDLDVHDEKWSKVCDNMLQGSAQLLGLLVWRIQSEAVIGRNCDELLHKLETAEREIEELKKRRREDAKANEKVVSIFAAQEQCWFSERRKLRQNIGALINELRVFDKKKAVDISGLNEKVKEMELLVQSKDKVLAEEERKRKELEEKLTKAENVAEELREAAKRDAQEHSTEIWKHKTAFIELVSNQRQLEAEMGRAIRQVDATKQELRSVSEQKEESMLMVQQLSAEMVKMHNDVEQKDKILSAMMRKSKLDTAEKQMLLKELKSSKTRRKQAEMETERLRVMSGSTLEKHSFRSMLARQANSRWEIVSSARGMHSSGTGSSHDGRTRALSTEVVHEYDDPEFRKEYSHILSPLSDQYSPEANNEFADVKRLEGWVRLEAEKYATVVEQRHRLEIDAFAEQMRLKDEKLEVFHWKLLSMEMETKRLKSHVEGLNHDISQLRHDNIKLEALLIEREEELNSLKEQVMSRLKLISCSKTNLNVSLNDPVLAREAVWSEVKIVKKKTGEMQRDVNDCKEVALIVQSPEKEVQEEKDDAVNQSPIEEVESPIASPLQIVPIENFASPSQLSTKTDKAPWRMDLNALGVSFKIKRLKQQLLLLERLAGKQECGENMESNDNGNFGIKGFLVLMSLLNKQVSRYQSLQGKTDDLCKRLHGNEPDLYRGESIIIARTKGETRTLEHYLEETFQLQRYIVATGQKMMEIQMKIGCEFVGVTEELDKSATFDRKRFGDGIRSLFQEVQRGLEVRIARIIGDLEGTLACEGMIHLRR